MGEEQYEVAMGVQKVLQRYKDLQDIIAILGMDELTEEDKRINRRVEFEIYREGLKVESDSLSNDF